MNRTANLLFLLALALLGAGCSPKIPFSQHIREQYKLNDAALKGLQYYNSHDIVLNRAESSANEQGTVEGTLVIESGKSVEQVTIPAGTPGIAERVPGTNSLAVSFEVGENTDLVFGTSNTNSNGRYTLMAPSWKGEKGKINYNGKIYYTSRGSGDTYLQFKMKRLNKVIRNQRTVKGRKI